MENNGQENLQVSQAEYLTHSPKLPLKLPGSFVWARCIRCPVLRDAGADHGTGRGRNFQS